MYHVNKEKRKRQMTERIELPNKDRVKTLGEKETCKYLEILEAVIEKQAEIREKIRVSQTNEKLLETNLCCRNVIKGIKKKTG